MAIDIQLGSVYSQLLAKENILVQQKDVETAYFDINNRILVLPMWDMSKRLFYMLLAHECAHAKYTPVKKWKREVEKFSSDPRYQMIFKQVVNVVEDARIDKMIMRLYPGVTKDYFKGQKELKDMDFFGIKKNNTEPKDTSLVNRLNIHFKTHLLDRKDKFDLPFTPEEMEFVKRMEDLETFEQVVQLSKELMEHQKEEVENMISQIQIVKVAISSDGDGEGSESGEPTEAIELSEEEAEKLKEIIDKMVSSDKELQEKLKTNAKNNRKRIDSINFRIPKNMLSKISDLKHTHTSPYTEGNNKFITTMYSEFERKKSAKEFQKIKEYKTGKLNPNKLHQYLLNDDVFLATEEIKVAKNHGFVFMCDWSGSMNGCHIQLLKQLYLFILFCKKASIPYEVYLFCNSYSRENLNVSGIPGSFSVEKVLTSKDKLSKIQNTIDWLKNVHTPNGGTPLTNTLAVSLPLIEQFKAKYKCEIVNYVLFSDGECNLRANSDAVISCRELGTIMPAEASYIGSTDYTAPLLKMLKYVEGTKTSVYYLKDNGKAVEVKEKCGGADTVFYVNKNLIFSGSSKDDLFLAKQLINAIS